MPTNYVDNLPDFTQCLSLIIAVIENVHVESVFILGDFNAHPGELFMKEMFDYCTSQKWICADVEKLQNVVPSSYTFVSDARLEYTRWLDHCLVTEANRLNACA